MRVLYHLTLSPSARKVRLVLAEKNLDFTLKLEKVWERRAEFLALNPSGEVPVLIEPDGTVLAGADAIVEYLDEVYREKILIGINPVDRAEVRRLCAWFDVKMNLEVTENLLGQKMMRRAGPAELAGDPGRPRQPAGPSRLYRLSRRAAALACRRPFLGRRHHGGVASLEPRLSRRCAVGCARAGQGMVCPDQVASELPPDPVRSRSRRIAAETLCRSRFLTRITARPALASRRIPPASGCRHRAAPPACAIG